MAPALKKVTVAIRVVALVYAYTIAVVVMHPEDAYPFIIAAQVSAPHARIFPNGRRLCMVQIEAWTFKQQMSKAHQTNFSKRLIK